MTTQVRKETEGGTPFYDLNFHCMLANPMSNEDIKKVEDLLRELEIKYYTK